MGDVYQNYLYGNFPTKTNPGSLSIQWHITTECDQSCKHCYMFEAETYQSEKENLLDLETCFRLVDQYNQILERLNISGNLAISGGDPILRPDFWELMDYIHNFKRISVALMGNPYHITDEVARRFRQYNIIAYQISLDGLEATHDYFRKPGSFQESLRALEVLNRNRINVNVMMTLSPENAADLIELYYFLGKLGYVNSFSFDRLVPAGAGKNLVAKGLMTAEEHRDLLYEMLISEIDKGQLVNIKKDHMWTPLLYEMGLLNPLPKEDIGICQGCGIPYSFLTVLSDGTIYSCRRMPIKIGKFPEENLWDVFMTHPLLDQFRDLTNYEKCRDCNLRNYCRGCAAVKYGYHGDPFKPDPHCWLKVGEGR